MLIEQIAVFLKNVLPILTTIFIAVLFAILLIRIIFRIFLHFAKKKYQIIKQKRQEKKAIKAEKVMPKEDEELLRKKENPRELIEKIISKEQREEENELKETKIVDIVKPVGFWTSMVLGNKLTYLVSSAKLMNKNSKKGFWVSMIEAQEKAQGRERGRSR